MTLDEVRNLFPHLDDGQFYFNHAALGPVSNFVKQRIEEFVTQRNGTKIENFETFLNYEQSAKEKLSKMINCSTTQLAWSDNVSNALNILANGIDWQKGDRIILNDIEFPSNIYPFLNLQSLGVEIDIVKSKDGIVDVEDLEKHVIDKTKLISISAVQFLSGYKADLNAIGKLCKENDIIFCVDAIQTTGVVDIDVKRDNIDFLVGGSQKWLMAMQGLSYLFITDELRNRIQSKRVGWTSVENPWNLLDYNLTLRDDASRFQTGTLNTLGVCALDASLSTFADYGLDNVYKNIRSNTEHFLNKLKELEIEPLLNTSSDKMGGIVSFKVAKAEELFTLLNEKRIFTAIREGIIRFSPHYYNTHEEIDSVIEILKSVDAKSYCK